MINYLRNKAVTAIICLLGLFLLSGCSKVEQGKALATVNGEPVYLKDFKRELALKVRQNPSFKVSPSTLDEILDLLINKKLIIQDAMKENLAEKEKFLNTITVFWEQTLIRDFIEYKNSLTAYPVSATDREIKDYYEKLKVRATFNITKRLKKEDIEILMKRVGNGESIDWDATVSLSYEEVPSETLSKAFDLSPGQMGIFEEGYMYYLIYVVSKEPVPIPSMEEVYPRIEENIRQVKQQRAFSEWLKNKRNNSDIKINKEVLQEVGG